jgi:Spy/CpxP family protein refolding chaperone
MQKLTFLGAALALALTASTAMAQPYGGYGMMGDYGYGMMGPGMMYGYDPGYGMMGGYYGNGPYGMMRGLWRDNLDENAATIRMAILAVAARG